MSAAASHRELAGFIWDICNLLRGPYKRNEYRKVILPMTVLRRFDCLLAPTKPEVLAAAEELKEKPEFLRARKLQEITGLVFYNTSPLDLPKLLHAGDDVEGGLLSYLRAFSPDVRKIFERFGLEAQVRRMAAKDRLYAVVKAFCDEKIDLSPGRVDNVQMGYAFEELIRIGAEQSNEEAGEHFTPREVIRLMVNLLLGPEPDLHRGHQVKTVLDPACGTGGMLSEAERYLLDLNAEARPMLYGQDYNDEAWAVCVADLLIKGGDPRSIKLADTFTNDRFAPGNDDGLPHAFDYVLANPPFGVEWKPQADEVKKEHKLGFAGRFGAGLPRITDGSLLFLQHMVDKLQPVEGDGSGGGRMAVVFNGSPLFTGDAGGGESEIRRWVIENDLLEAVVALPEQLFYNTGIATYVWLLTNRKKRNRKGKVQLIDARRFWVPMKKSLGNKRRKLGGDRLDPAAAGEPRQIDRITELHANFQDGETETFPVPDHRGEPVDTPLVVSRVFPNEEFGYRKVTVERPLRLNFAAVPDRLARLAEQTAFKNLAKSKKKSPAARAAGIAEGEARQAAIRGLLDVLAEETGGKVFQDREAFTTTLKRAEKATGTKLKGPERKAVLAALAEPDPTADVCRNRRGEPEPDPALRDTERVPLTEDVDEYLAREVLPHATDASADPAKEQVGYEIPLNRRFHRYEPPRDLAAIDADLRELEGEIVRLLGEVTA